MNQEQASQVKDLAKSCNDVLEKLGWKWEPKVGEWCIYYCSGANLSLITKVTYDEIYLHNFHHGQRPEYPEEYISILSWEGIERVLEGVGYQIDVWEDPNKKGTYECELDIKTEHPLQTKGKSRQEAAMRAVIELGEKIKS